MSMVRVVNDENDGMMGIKDEEGIDDDQTQLHAHSYIDAPPAG